LWLAASLSRQDCELACDEAVLQNRSEEERIDYGRILLAFASSDMKGMWGKLQCSTSISGGKKQLKERILFLTLRQEKSRNAAVPVLLALLASLVTFTGSLNVRAMEEKAGMSEQSLTNDSADGGTFDGSAVYAPDDISGIPMAEGFSPENTEQSSEGIPDGRIIADLNFDGYEDFALPAGEGAEESYYCYLWNPRKGRFEQNGMMPGVWADEEAELLVNRKTDEEGPCVTRYYRFDQEGSFQNRRQTMDSRIRNRRKSWMKHCSSRRARRFRRIFPRGRSLNNLLP